eukprot:GFKZ01000565.1.p1 GENE.GFKZ01000565.1~~GFKZ01000565.1.p1  ORF type:complete len:109 (-),score=5.09 GFKZ01000565.1:234-560(-)
MKMISSSPSKVTPFLPLPSLSISADNGWSLHFDRRPRNYGLLAIGDAVSAPCNAFIDGDAHTGQCTDAKFLLSWGLSETPTARGPQLNLLGTIPTHKVRTTVKLTRAM